MKSNYIIAALVLVIIILLLRTGCQKKQIDTANDKASLSNAANDTLRKEPDGSVSKAVFAAEDVEMLRAEIAKKDKQLAEALRKGAKVGIKTVVELQIDTVVVNDTVIVADSNTDDIRKAKVITKDYTADITSYKNSTRMQLSATDTVRYSIGTDFRLKADHSWKDLNVVEMESFYVKPKKTRSGWKFWVGVAVGAAGVYGVTR